MDCLSDRAAPQLWGTKPRAAATRVENKKQTGGFGDRAAGSKLLNLFSGTFVLCRTSNGEAIFHPFFTSFLYFPENAGEESVRRRRNTGGLAREVRGRAEGCDGWEREMRSDQKALECLRVPLRADAATENVVALLQETHPSVSVWGSGRNVAAKKQNEPTASHLKHILHVTFTGKIWFEGCQSLIGSWQPYRSIINSLTISIYSENLNLSQK